MSPRLCVREIAELRQYPSHPAPYQDRSGRGEWGQRRIVAVSPNHVVERFQIGREHVGGAPDVTPRQMDEAKVEARFLAPGRIGKALRDRKRPLAGFQRGVQGDDRPGVLAQVARNPTLPTSISERDGQDLGRS